MCISVQHTESLWQPVDLLAVDISFVPDEVVGEVRGGREPLPEEPALHRHHEMDLHEVEGDGGVGQADAQHRLVARCTAAQVAQLHISSWDPDLFLQSLGTEFQWVVLEMLIAVVCGLKMNVSFTTGIITEHADGEWKVKNISLWVHIFALRNKSTVIWKCTKLSSLSVVLFFFRNLHFNTGVTKKVLLFETNKDISQEAHNTIIRFKLSHADN